MRNCIGSRIRVLSWSASAVERIAVVAFLPPAAGRPLSLDARPPEDHEHGAKYELYVK